MNESSLISFKNLSAQNEADELILLLEKNGIPSKCSVDQGELDYVFQGQNPTHKFEILIRKEDHEKAEALLLKLASTYLNDVTPDYYLFSFTDDELLELLIKKNEWSEFDVLLAQKILNDRNVPFNSKEIERKQEIHELELAEPEGGQEVWIVIGYLMAILGGFFGLLIGYMIWQAKNKLPNGTKVYAYNDTVRRHGNVIFYISTVTFPIGFLIKFVYENNLF